MSDRSALQTSQITRQASPNDLACRAAQQLPAELTPVALALHLSQQAPGRLTTCHSGRSDPARGAATTWTKACPRLAGHPSCALLFDPTTSGESQLPGLALHTKRHPVRGWAGPSPKVLDTCVKSPFRGGNAQ